MASGFFLGGAAEGMQNVAELGLKRDTLAADTGLRTRALDIQEQSQKNTQQREILTRADTQIDETLKVVDETISEALKAGKDPIAVQKAVAPLVESAKNLATKAGRDPSAIDSRVLARFLQPTKVETGTAEGAAAGAKAVAEAKALNEAPGSEGDNVPGGIKGKDKIAAEGSLRDDFLKQAAPYITMRDAKNRLDNLDKSGAGDMALVFQFMKILDPGSTVREGEYATASNSGGVPSAIQGLYNKALGEGTIGDKARREILSQANKIYQSAAVQHDKLSTQFAGIAKRQGLKIENVVPDLLPAGAGESVTPGGIKFKVVR